MTMLKEWLLGVTAAAMLIALAESLMPPGSVRRIGKLSGGLILVIAILQPVLTVEYAALAESFSQYRNDLGEYQVQPQTGNFQIMKTIIEARSAAYIQDKAEGLGIACEAEVSCAAESTQSYPYPAFVNIKGNLNAGQIRQLQELIEKELAIPAEKQSYSEEDGEGP